MSDKNNQQEHPGGAPRFYGDRDGHDGPHPQHLAEYPPKADYPHADAMTAEEHAALEAEAAAAQAKLDAAEAQAAAQNAPKKPLA